jgi:hypothetical protein
MANYPNAMAGESLKILNEADNKIEAVDNKMQGVGNTMEGVEGMQAVPDGSPTIAEPFHVFRY